ncbi:hypothetical protein [Pseudomonas sp. NPDC089569]|uniref:hypothetical protein n=1 Tax=Pseudomonas sp. NPDC089569 TaxID=3390722 RepID=UPI003CFBFE74
MILLLNFLGALISIGLVALFLRYVLPVFLSDEQRYGIDELGIAQTPEYMAEKRAREERLKAFDRLPSK